MALGSLQASFRCEDRGDKQLRCVSPRTLCSLCSQVCLASAVLAVVLYPFSTISIGPKDGAHTFVRSPAAPLSSQRPPGKVACSSRVVQLCLVSLLVRRDGNGGGGGGVSCDGPASTTTQQPCNLVCAIGTCIGNVNLCPLLLGDDRHQDWCCGTGELQSIQRKALDPKDRYFRSVSSLRMAILHIAMRDAKLLHCRNSQCSQIYDPTRIRCCAFKRSSRHISQF